MCSAGTGMVVLAHKWHIFKAPDPLFFMVLLLTHTTPTAINLQVGHCAHILESVLHAGALISL